jgi:hypothetical protein
MGAKSEDRWCVPLCSEHHRGVKGQHARGEQDWYIEQGIDPIAIAAFLWGVTGDYEAGCKIVRHSYFHLNEAIKVRALTNEREGG